MRQQVWMHLRFETLLTILSVQTSFFSRTQLHKGLRVGSAPAASCFSAALAGDGDENAHCCRCLPSLIPLLDSQTTSSHPLPKRLSCFKLSVNAPLVFLFSHPAARRLLQSSLKNQVSSIFVKREGPAYFRAILFVARARYEIWKHFTCVLPLRPFFSRTKKNKVREIRHRLILLHVQCETHSERWQQSWTFQGA